MPAMMNPYQMMRMRRLFTPDEEQEVVPPPTQPQGRNWEQLMSEQGPVQKSYLDHLATMPDEADFKPSLGRRLGASLVAGIQGFGGNPNAMKTGESILRAPFNNAMSRFNNKAARLKEASGIEEATYKNRLSGRKLDVDEADKKEDNERLREDYSRKLAEGQALEGDREKRRTETSRHNRAMEGNAARNTANAENRTKKYGEFVDKYGSKNSSGTPSPSRVTAAEKQAVIDVIKEFPEYQEFADTNNLPMAVDKTEPQMSFFGLRDSTRTNPKRADYDKFLAEVKKRKQALLGSGPYNDVYPLEEE